MAGDAAKLRVGGCGRGAAPNAARPDRLTQVGAWDDGFADQSIVVSSLKRMIFRRVFFGNSSVRTFRMAIFL